MTLPVTIDQALFQQLTPREQAFVMHPLAFTDPRQACIEVGYAETTANTKGYIMRHQLMYYIMPIHEKRMDDIGVSAERIIKELAYIAFSNEVDYYDTIDVEGDTIKVLKDLARLPEGMQRAIKNIEYGTVIVADGKTFQSVLSIKLYDKQNALKELKEIIGLNDPRFRKPLPDGNAEDTALLDQLEPDELEIVSRMYAKAADRVRDTQAIVGTAKRIPNKRKDKE